MTNQRILDNKVGFSALPTFSAFKACLTDYKITSTIDRDYYLQQTVIDANKTTARKMVTVIVRLLKCKIVQEFIYSNNDKLEMLYLSALMYCFPAFYKTYKATMILLNVQEFVSLEQFILYYSKHYGYDKNSQKAVESIKNVLTDMSIVNYKDELISICDLSLFKYSSDSIKRSYAESVNVNVGLGDYLSKDYLLHPVFSLFDEMFYYDEYLELKAN